MNGNNSIQKRFENIKRKNTIIGTIVLSIGVLLSIVLIFSGLNVKKEQDRKNAVIQAKIDRLEEEKQAYKEAWLNSSGSEATMYFNLMSEKSTEIFKTKETLVDKRMTIFTLIGLGSIAGFISLSVGLFYIIAPRLHTAEDLAREEEMDSISYSSTIEDEEYEIDE